MWHTKCFSQNILVAVLERCSFSFSQFRPYILQTYDHIGNEDGRQVRSVLLVSRRWFLFTLKVEL